MASRVLVIDGVQVTVLVDGELTEERARELVDVVRSIEAAQHQGPALRSCIACGCTNDAACSTPVGPCFWLTAPDEPVQRCSACPPVSLLDQRRRETRVLREREARDRAALTERYDRAAVRKERY